jgi:fructosamine-3-kinase
VATENSKTWGRAVSRDELLKDDVAAFLSRRHDGSIVDLEPLGGGFWSSAWGYRIGHRERVLRIGRNASWFEADRLAMEFSRSDLPVPDVLEIGRYDDERAFAISVRHRGQFLESTPAALSSALASTLTGLLTALFEVPRHIGSPVLWHSPNDSPGSWREFLLEGLVDDPHDTTHGWRAILTADAHRAALATAAEERIRELVEACPERRDLVHGDLLHGNVLITPDAGRVTAVYSWKCSVRGDFLYDAAWCSFWSPWHETIATANPLAGLLSSPVVLANPTALVDAAIRHHCYELQIGFTHLGWNIWTDNQVDLEATCKRLGEILERGPHSLFRNGTPAD